MRFTSILRAATWSNHPYCSDGGHTSILTTPILYPAAVLDSLGAMLRNDDLLDRVSLLASHPYSDIAGQAGHLECLLEQFIKIEDALL